MELLPEILELNVRRIGILLVIAGTVLIALSVKARTTKPPDRYPVRVVGETVPSETMINRPMLWGGLALVGVGSVQQW